MIFSQEYISKQTPMMQSYMGVKNQHPDKMLFFRLGDFYELFFNDAIEASKILNITLTKRNNSNNDGIPMAGVPFHAIDVYLQKLVSQGISVVICEQVGEPSSKGIMDRKISQIITPGTVLDSNLLNEKEIRILASIYKKSSQFEISWLNISNGEIFVYNTNLENLHETLSQINPNEILVSEKQRTLIPTGDYFCSYIQDWEYDSITSEVNLKNIFGTNYNYKFDIPENRYQGVISSLVNYVQFTQNIDFTFLQSIKQFQNEDYLNINQQTRKHLEFFDGRNSFYDTLDNCSTPMGARLLKNWLNYPIKDKAVIKSRHERVEFLFEKNKQYITWKNISSEWCDIERIATRIAIKNVKPKELANLRDTLRSMNKLQDWAEKLPPKMKGLFIHALPNDSILKLLEKYLIENPSNLLRDGDVIAYGLDSQLDECRSLQENHSEFLKKYEIEEKSKHNIPNLRVEFNSTQGFFISISNSHIEKIPDYYERKQTLKNCERFTTEYLKEYEIKSLSAKEKSLHLEKKLYEDLLQKLKIFVTPLIKQAKILAEWDILNAFAEISDKYNYVKPNFGNTFIIKESKHPCFYRDYKNFTANNLLMDESFNSMIITGPNMGGKSTYMRQIGLLIVMAHLGCFVPATYFEIPEIDGIFSRIGAHDDITNKRSTFMVEMNETSYILNNATEKSFVIIDELGRGTATYDGLSLAWSICEYLSNKVKAHTLFATHYLEMTELAQTHSNIRNYNVQAITQNDEIIFEHKVLPGAANRSYGIHVAKLAGINDEIIFNAKTKLQTLESQTNKHKNETHECKDICEEIKNLDISNMSPIQALNILNNFKSQITKNFKF